MESHHGERTPDGPYAAAAEVYLKAGWSPLPLPLGRKAPVPVGWTGRDGGWPSFPDIAAWTEDRGNGNVALRLPPSVFGVDCDNYDAKPGALVLQALEAQHGPLPATWRTTSRDDGISGIRLYRIPEGMRWPGVLGPGIETIRYDHRYAVAWPSVHPNGATYRWINPDGATVLADVPQVDDLPDLPDAWVAALTGGELATDQLRANLTDAATNQWLAPRGAGAPCRRIDRAQTRGLADLVTGTSRHDVALQVTNRIIWHAGEGHPGALTALDAVRTAFLTNVTTGAGARDMGDAGAEWDRMIFGAVRIAAAAHPNPSPDPCDDPFAGLINRESGPWKTSPQTPCPTSATTSAFPQAASSTEGSQPCADDLTENLIHRNQATAQELERMRAQRAAARQLDIEDGDAVVEDQVRRKVIQEKAALAYKILTEPPAPPFDLGTLAEILARPADPPMRVDGLLPWAGSGLVVAQRKTGKTTLLLNYARCLLTGEAFLGQFDVIPLEADAAVAFLNYEVSAQQLGRWAHEVGVPQDRLIMVNLRGRRNPLGHPTDRAVLAQTLKEKNVQAVIVDPFGRAYTGVSQNDNGEVQAFLVGLELFVREEVGALDLLLATHAGWDGERTRGASALEDWGDTVITLTRDGEDESRRFMKAIGRDVDIDEDELVMDPLTRVLTRTGNGSRRAQKGGKDDAKLAVFVTRAVHQHPGCSKADIQKAITAMEDYQGDSVAPGRGDTRIKNAIACAEKAGRVRVEKGGRGMADRHFEATTTTTTDHHRGGGSLTTTTPVFKRGGGGSGTGGDLSTNDGGGGSPRPHRILVDGNLIDRDSGEVLTRERDTEVDA